MKSFRARSQLLVSRLEDSDEVMQQAFIEEVDEEAIGQGDDVPVEDSQEHETWVHVVLLS